MSFKERPYQREMDEKIQRAWAAGARDVVGVLATGAGKTVLVSNIIERERGASAFIAHRQELVSQISLALARNGVRHRVIGSVETQRACVASHMSELGKNHVDPTAQAAAVGIDTLVRMDPKDPWLAQVSLVVTDETHHLLRENKWGKGRAMFPNARGLGVTATPLRSDGKGLGRRADGFFDVMIEGVGMRELISMGYLTNYRIFAPPNNLDLTTVGTSAGGDYSPPALRQAVHKSRITGDVVEHYKRIAPGKLGVTFAVDIEAGKELTEAFRAAGVPAELVTGNTPDGMRQAVMRRFRNREILQLVNCDLFGEGFDLPSIEVVSMARPTQSFGLYVQQFGRALRPMAGKDHALILDHVGNVERFAKTRGLPDTPQVWTLERRERTAKGAPSDAEPTRTCTKCSGAYTIVEHGMTCPYCRNTEEPAGRSSPAMVDGVLCELDPEVLRALRREVDDVDGPADTFGSYAQGKAMHRNHIERQRAQQELRATLALWGGWQESLGRTAEQAQRAFFVRYATTGMQAAALGPVEARALDERVRAQLRERGVIIDDTVNKEPTT